MLLVAICDDLQNDRIKIQNFIKDYCVKEDYDINIYAFENGEALVKYYIAGKASFDIIFLDIYMSGENGINIAKQIRKYDSDCKIIFSTTSAEHALESFEVSPLNYLTKPISKVVFDSAFEKAMRTIDKEKQKSLPVKVGSNIQTVYYKDILFIESAAKILNIHMVKNKKLTFCSKLDDIEAQINDKRFIRCHKSFLVNMDHILSIENYSFKLIDGIEIPIVQRNFASIKKRFYDFILDKANLKNDSGKVD
ncbi:MAG: LytR/AlgR family response regulator transcription factor [Ignavibacteriales bacterium]